MKYYQIVYRDYKSDPLSPMDFKECVLSAFVPWEEGLYVDNMSYMDNFALLVSGISEDPFVLLPDGSYINKNNVFKIIPAPNIKDESSDKSEKRDSCEVKRPSQEKNWESNYNPKKHGNRRNFRPHVRPPEKIALTPAVEKGSDDLEPLPNITSMNNTFSAGEFE